MLCPDHGYEGILDRGSSLARGPDVDPCVTQDVVGQRDRVGAALESEAQHVPVVRYFFHAVRCPEQCRRFYPLVDLELGYAKRASIHDFLGSSDVQQVTAENESEAMAALRLI